MQVIIFIAAALSVGLTACGQDVFVKSTPTPTVVRIPGVEPSSTRVTPPTPSPTPTPTPAQPAPTLTPVSTPTPRPTPTSTATPTRPPTATHAPSPISTPVPTPEIVEMAGPMSPTPLVACDPSYPDFCIPPPPPDLNCDDVSDKNFKVLPPDPHNLDGDSDGIGCVS